MAISRQKNLLTLINRICDNKMTDADFTILEIYEHLIEIKNIYDDFRERNGIENDYLDLTLLNGNISFNNCYYDLEEHQQIQFFQSEDE